MKRISLLFLSLLLVGCQSSPHADNQNEQSSSQENVANNESTEETEANSEEKSEETGQAKSDGTRSAWTDYSAYAKLDEEGYGYYIHDDPDISSEIFPMQDTNSEDVLLFTFDDAPQMPEAYSLEIAKTLKEKDVNAIFLVNGMYLEEAEGRDMIKEVYDMGFEIGNHTQTHANLRELTYDQQYEEISQTSQMVEEITGEKPRWFRPPFGLFNMDTILICNELGMQLMTWSFGYDWMDEYLDADALAEVSVNNEYLRGGANILMHDRSWTSDALERMIDGYREKGYHIVDPLIIKSQENSTAPMQ